MAKISQKKSGVILSYISYGVYMLSAFLYTPIMLRLLGQSEYGLYQLVNSVVSYLGLLSFGFSGAYTRFYSRYKKDNDENSIAKLNGLFSISLHFMWTCYDAKYQAYFFDGFNRSGIS